MSLNDAIQKQQTLVIDYTNYRGERSVREVVPLDIYFGSNEWHPEPQWLMRALDIQKDKLRIILLTGIHGIKTIAQAASEGGTRP